MKKWLWLVLLAVCWPSVASADVTVNDFAYGIRIDVPGGTAIGAMSLPEAVYRNTFRPDLGDLRVFNASGEPVPHMIRFSQTRQAEAPWRSLPFFPLPEAASPEAGGVPGVCPHRTGRGRGAGGSPGGDTATAATADLSHRFEPDRAQPGPVAAAMATRR